MLVLVLVLAVVVAEEVISVEVFAMHIKEAIVIVEVPADSVTMDPLKGATIVVSLLISNQVVTETSKCAMHGNVVTVTREMLVDLAMEKRQHLIVLLRVQNALKVPVINSRLEPVIAENLVGLAITWMKEVILINIEQAVVFVSHGNVASVIGAAHADLCIVKNLSCLRFHV